MENWTDILAVVLGVCLSGVLWTCWQGRERRTQPRRWLPYRFRLIYAPRGRPQPAAASEKPRPAPAQQLRPEGREGKMAYTDQMLAESLLAARRRRDALERLDERLRKPASSLGWAAKT